MLIAEREPAVAIQQQTKFCTKGCHDRPISEFRFERRSTGTRSAWCRDCRNAADRLRRARLRSKALEKFASEIRRAQGTNQVAALCGRMFRQFGGVEGLVQAWAAEIKAARIEAPGSRRVLSSFLAIIRLMATCQTRDESAELSGLSGQELAAVQEQAACDYLAANPAMILAAAEHLGWKIVPPGGSESEAT